MKVLDELQSKMEENRVDMLLVSSPENFQYMTGYRRYGQESCYLLLSREQAVILAGELDIRHMGNAAGDFTLEAFNGPEQIVGFVEKVYASLRKPCIKVGIEVRKLPYSVAESIVEGGRIEAIEDIGGYFDALRIVKDRQELQLIRKAVKLNDIGHERARMLVSDGRPTETELYGSLFEKMQRSADCHITVKADVISGSKAGGVGAPIEVMSDKAILAGEPVIVDLSCQYKGYWGDTTTTCWNGTLSRELTGLHSVVEEAKALAVASIREGVRVCDVVAKVRSLFEKYDCMRYIFGDSLFLGHGIGLDYFEQPVLVESNEQVFRRGMCVTVEPGLYIPGVGGIRLEDNILVQKDGCVKFQDIKGELE